MKNPVCVNRTLNMRKIEWIGLDMDHTLVRYYVEKFESLVYQLVQDSLVANEGYPSIIKNLKFDFKLAVRGLVIDSQNGNILKLSRYGAIKQSNHGTKPIDYITQNKIYRSIYVDLADPNYMAIDTSFAIAFCVLYSQLVDLKDEHPELFPSYELIANNVLNHVDKIHADGSLKNIICDNLSSYVIRDKNIVLGLERYISYGKKFFLLTNSSYNYTKTILDYAINPYLTEGKTWQDLFVYTITTANKPRFFYENSDFISIDKDTLAEETLATSIRPGIYRGGNAVKLSTDLGLMKDEILYIGDHIYGDIVRLKKDCNWRTAMVVEELNEELVSEQNAKPYSKELELNMSLKINLEQKIIKLQTKNIDENILNHDNELLALQGKLFALDNKISKLIAQQNSYFNPIWGKLFRAGAEESFFAYQVDRYACIYMGQLAHLFAHSPLTYFRAHLRAMAHDDVIYHGDF